ncbi:MAG: hypothetical protein HS104_21870 [Polyangiaceae bacterium]|nr:hypothetical protein [Polyangiaceae bacterium]MBK8998952.1 hypothetical protein [Myxococcales bacterium]MCL4752993.1 hypothetical protein [Myxococcales bacterium]
MAAQGFHPETNDLVDQEIRHSIRVIKQQRYGKMVGFIALGVMALVVLFVGAYLGLR